MSEIWFTSDHHWGHKNIIDFCNRPFSSVEEMDEVMIQNWNANVAPEDEVFYLGDGWMGSTDETFPYISRLNGTIVLLPGNHDKCWVGKAAGDRLTYWRNKYIGFGISKIVDTGDKWGFPEIQIGNETVRMNHFPPVGDSHEKKHQDKFSYFRPPDDDMWLLHGHVHNNNSRRPVEGKWINVGVDVWDFIPVNISWVENIISEYSGMV